MPPWPQKRPTTTIGGINGLLSGFIKLMRLSYFLKGHWNCDALKEKGCPAVPISPPSTPPPAAPKLLGADGLPAPELPSIGGCLKSRVSLSVLGRFLLFAALPAAQPIPRQHPPFKMRLPKLFLDLGQLLSHIPRHTQTKKLKIMNSTNCRNASPGGASDNSPAFQRRENGLEFPSPDGTADSAKFKTRNHRKTGVNGSKNLK